MRKRESEIEKLPETMTMEEWCVFDYRAIHQSDPRARLMLGRLYKNAAHLMDNMRYALFWLGMAYTAYIRQGDADPVFEKEISDEITSVEEELSEEETTYIPYLIKSASIFPFGISGAGVPSEEEVARFRNLV